MSNTRISVNTSRALDVSGEIKETVNKLKMAGLRSKDDKSTLTANISAQARYTEAIRSTSCMKRTMIRETSIINHYVNDLKAINKSAKKRA